MSNGPLELLRGSKILFRCTAGHPDPANRARLTIETEGEEQHTKNIWHVFYNARGRNFAMTEVTLLKIASSLFLLLITFCVKHQVNKFKMK